MEISTLIAGTLQREYLLPPEGKPLLDVPGGGMLYAAAGAALWRGAEEARIALLAHVGEDYPRVWLDEFARRGFDVRGIRILAQQLDLRHFRAYLGDGSAQTSNPVAHFARLGIAYPKSLLGYQAAVHTEPRAPAAEAPHPEDIPASFEWAHGVHLCPLDHLSANRLITAFHEKRVENLSLDPAAGWMIPAFMPQVRTLLHGLTAFLPAEEEVRALFWGQSDDLWQMAEALAGFGCDLVVIKRGGRGQMLYDAAAHTRWEIPAYPARLADPTHAGDSFCGGFLHTYIQHFEPLRAVLGGSVAASLAIEGSGAFHAMEALAGLAEARLRSLQAVARKV